MKPWHKWTLGMFLVGSFICINIGVVKLLAPENSEDRRMNIPNINRSTIVETSGQTPGHSTGIPEFQDFSTVNIHIIDGGSYRNNSDYEYDTNPSTSTAAITSSITEVGTKSIEEEQSSTTARLAPSFDTTEYSVPSSTPIGMEATESTGEAPVNQTGITDTLNSAISHEFDRKNVAASFSTTPATRSTTNVIITTTTPQLQLSNVTKSTRPIVPTNCKYKNGNSGFKCLAAKPTYRPLKSKELFRNGSSNGNKTTNKPVLMIENVSKQKMTHPATNVSAT